VRRVAKKYEEEETLWKQQKQELAKQIQEQYVELNRVKGEAASQLKLLKTKVTEYKQKVKQANAQIHILTQRLA
jgi:hypothetical protein